MSRYRICKELGVNQATLSRFMSRQRGLTLDMLDRLAALLDFTVAAGRQPGLRRRTSLHEVRTFEKKTPAREKKITGVGRSRCN